MLPSRYLALPMREKAFIIAAIELKTEAERQKEKELERKSRR